MKRYTAAFNIYLLMVLAGLFVGAGCVGPPKEPTKGGKEYCLFRLSVEAPAAVTNNTVLIQVPRGAPVTMRVLNEPFLKEDAILKATVEEDIRGYYIRVQYDDHGRFGLEATTTSSRGKHLAIFAEWTEPRWLAAPLIGGTIRDGSLIFTPDATREEAETIVRGINNFAKKVRK